MKRPPRTADQDALSAMMNALPQQVAGYELLFFRAAIEGSSNEGPPSHYDIRKALKAQNLCRMTLTVLLVLRAIASRRRKKSTSKLLQTENLLHGQPFAEFERLGAPPSLDSEKFPTTKLLQTENLPHDQPLGAQLQSTPYADCGERVL
jgi:hypothetical protein